MRCCLAGSDKTSVFGRLRKKPTAAMAKKCNPDALAALPANDFLLPLQELPTTSALIPHPKPLK